MAKKKDRSIFRSKKEDREKAEATAEAQARRAALGDIEKPKADESLLQDEILEKAKEVRTHVVVSGDTLTGIALKYYGNAGEFMKIYEANKEVIGDNPDRILVGMELVIPEL